MSQNPHQNDEEKGLSDAMRDLNVEGGAPRVGRRSGRTEEGGSSSSSAQSASIPYQAPVTAAAAAATAAVATSASASAASAPASEPVRGSEFESRLKEQAFDISAQDRRDMRTDTISYDAQRMIGHGSFGAVFLAKTVETNEVVAIKKVLQDKRFKNRELQIMRQLAKQPHPFVVLLRHHFISKGSKGDDVYLNLVLEFVPETMYSVAKQYIRAKEPFPVASIKIYMYQLSRALAHIHGLGVCHRDVKPQNLLVNPKTFTLKLCDFGSAKALVRGEPNIAYICSRYYRAPELIFGSTDYTTAVDVWSQGCVMAELLIGSPLFPGSSGVDQLVEIIKILGTPTKDELKSMNPNYQEFRFPQIRAQPWANIFRSSTPADAKELLQILLAYTPQRRFKAIEACGHPFFNDLRAQGALLPDNTPLPLCMFQFTEEELALNPSMHALLVPAHISGAVTAASAAATSGTTSSASAAASSRPTGESSSSSNSAAVAATAIETSRPTDA